MEQPKSRFLVGGILTLGLLMFLFSGSPLTQEQSGHQGHSGHDEHADHGGMSMPVGTAGSDAMTPAALAKLQEDKRESEFNHHLAGFLVALAGLFIFLQPGLAKRWLAVKYAWPACFLVSGVFVLVWSDTELWPFGPRGWVEALQNNPEVLQHKTYAALLLALGTIEWQRTRGVLKAAWSGWVFPALAIMGSVLLLFHQHEGGTHGPDHLELMARIQSEHTSYSLAGIGVGLTNGLSNMPTRWQGVFCRVWPLSMMLLGILLMFYRE